MLLSTLIKTRLRANRFPLILSCCILIAAGVISAILHPFIVNENLWDTFGFFSLALVSMYSGTWFAIIAAFVIGGFLIFYSLYTMYGTQSAYLYFTLPCSRKQVFHASMITYLIESLLLSVALGIGLCVAFLPFLLMEEFDINAVMQHIHEWFELLFSKEAFNMIVFCILNILSVIVSFILGIILSASACVFGCSYAKKYKLVGTVVAAMIISTITGTITSIVSVITSFIGALLTSANSNETLSDVFSSSIFSTNITFAISLIVSVVMAFAAYKLTLKRLETGFDIE